MDTHKNARSDAQRSRDDGSRGGGLRAVARPPPRASSIRRRRRSPNGSSGSTPRAWKVCATARQDRFHRRAKRRLPPALPSRLCADSATPASRSPPRSAFSAATVSRILKRLGLNRLSALEPAEPVRRYERAAPGEIIHIDIKKLGRFNRIGHRITGDRTGQSNTRGVGWEFVHLAIDDHSRLAYSEILPDEKRASACAFSSTPCASFEASASRSSAS